MAQGVVTVFKHWWKRPQLRFHDQPHSLNYKAMILCSRTRDTENIRFAAEKE